MNKKWIAPTVLLVALPATSLAWKEGTNGGIAKMASMTSGDLGCMSHFNSVNHSDYPQPMDISAGAFTLSMLGDTSASVPSYPPSVCWFPSLTTDHKARGGFNIFLIKRTGQNSDGTDRFSIAKWWAPRNLAPDASGFLISNHTVNFTDWWSPDYVSSGPGYYAVVSCLYRVVASGDYFGLQWSSQPITDTDYECKVSVSWHPVFNPGEGPGPAHTGPMVRLRNHYSENTP